MDAHISKSNLAALLAQAVQGDAAARESLFALYRPYLRLRAVQQLPRMLAKRTDASDIVQQTLLDAVRGLPDFKGQSEPEFTAWMTKLLERNLLQSVRQNTYAKRDIRLERDLSRQGDSAEMIWHSLAGDGASPMSSVFRGEAALYLAHALDQLPEDQRTAVELRYIAQHPLQAIAEAMERSVGSVVGLIRRGVEALQQRLPREFGEAS